MSETISGISFIMDWREEDNTLHMLISPTNEIDHIYLSSQAILLAIKFD